jgi:hypothetical protein
VQNYSVSSPLYLIGYVSVSIATFHILFMCSLIKFETLFVYILSAKGLCHSHILAAQKYKFVTATKKPFKRFKAQIMYLARGDEWLLQKTSCSFCSRPLIEAVQPQKGRDTHPVGKQLCSEQIAKLQNGQRFQHNLRCQCQ